MKAEKITIDRHSIAEIFGALGERILSGDKELEKAVTLASAHNKWFTPENCRYALSAIAIHFLNTKKLEQWLSGYSIPSSLKRGKIGVIMAGNIPLAGFHDLLCVLASGHTALVKQSSKDRHLLPALLNLLYEIDSEAAERVQSVEQLKNMDAIIATGGNNSARYFEYYFGKYPHIIRKNRNSVAVLSGKETTEQLRKLGSDIFLYFGLGCRSVSKLYVPAGYDFKHFFEALEPFSPIIFHNGYKNNFDYNLALLIMNRSPYLSSDFLILTENSSLSSPVATIYYEYYNHPDEVKRKLLLHKDEIQCVVSDMVEGSVAFGEAQSPQLCDYADGIDTMKFLTSLNVL